MGYFSLANQLKETKISKIIMQIFDFLKEGYHGSNTLSTLEFFDTVSPRIAVISCRTEEAATNNGYNHPRHITINNLSRITNKRVGIPGTIEVFNFSINSWTQIISREEIYITNIEEDLVFYQMDIGFGRNSIISQNMD